MELPLVEIKIGQVSDGEQRLELWVTTSKTADGTGRTMQKLVDVPVKVDIPIKDA